MNSFNRTLKFLAFYSLNQRPFFPTRGLSKVLNSVDRYLVFSLWFSAIVNQEVAYFTRTMRSYYLIAQPPTPGEMAIHTEPYVWLVFVDSLAKER